jgi:hypothetical protein
MQVICTTGLDHSERESISKKASQLGFSMSKPFTSHVTLLIAKEPGSEKFEVKGVN